MKSVVFVDDDAEVCCLVKKFLEMSGEYIVDTFTDAEKGLKAIMGRCCDLAILDVHMPKMSGIDMLRKIKAEPECSFIPVVILTGDETPVTQDHAMGAYADAYIAKPFTQHELVKSVTTVIGNRLNPAKVF